MSLTPHGDSVILDEDMSIPEKVIQINETLWEIPTSFKKGMRVPARIYATDKLLSSMDEGVFEQISNVATLPGILDYAFCMPDGHWGYGFPIGGAAAFDIEKGVGISQRVSLIFITFSGIDISASRITESPWGVKLMRKIDRQNQTEKL